ncbi:hypothetical protein C357_11004 [Citreicella sp. 357]|nr:hypothetical protein C357_11004 [Citreicella sp. 357]
MRSEEFRLALEQGHRKPGAESESRVDGCGR